MSREAGFPISATIRQKSRIAGLHAYQKAFGLRFDAVRVLLLAFVGWIAMPAAVGGGAWGEVPAHVYSYRVIHPIYGDIGSYTNIIENRGTETAVRNKFRVTVKILFAVAYEQKGDNSELWRDGRMVSFEGSMKKNGKRSKIRGYAQGDKFVIEGTRGKVVAPGNVFPNNPWSPKILGTNVLMGTGSGKLYRVKSSEGDERVIDINGKTVKTRYFKVDGDARYELWFDETGVPVKFTDIGDDVTITYRLVRRTIQPIPRILKGGLTSP
jgi:hypothetical protein